MENKDDKNTPEKVLGYKIYFKEQLPILKKTLNDVKITDCRRLIPEMWADLPADQKQPFYDRAKQQIQEKAAKKKNKAKPVVQNTERLLPRKTRGKQPQQQPQKEATKETPQKTQKTTKKEDKKEKKKEDPAISEKITKKNALMDILQNDSPKIPRITKSPQQPAPPPPPAPPASPAPPQSPQQQQLQQQAQPQIPTTPQGKSTPTTAPAKKSASSSSRKKHHHSHKKRYLAPTIIIVPYPLILQPGQTLPSPIEYSVEQFEAYRRTANNRKSDRISTSSSSYSDST